MPENTLSFWQAREEARYFIRIPDSALGLGLFGPQTINQIKDFARLRNETIKFFDEQGMLRGTAYPNGEVQW